MVLGVLLCSGPTLLASFIERRRDDDIYERTGWCSNQSEGSLYAAATRMRLCRCVNARFRNTVLVLACSVRPLRLDAQ